MLGIYLYKQYKQYLAPVEIAYEMNLIYELQL